MYDVIIIGGGPAGLSAALALGRACKRVLLCDAGPRRNAAATHVHNFVSRDGTPPSELRAIARQQLAAYVDVEVREARVERLAGSKGAFRATVDGVEVEARRAILCTGLIDEMLPLDGFRELWGHAIFQCPYCHGWEHRGQAWGYLAREPEAPHFPVFLRGWTRTLSYFTGGAFELPAEHRAQLEQAGVRVVTAPVRRLVARGEPTAPTLDGLELASGEIVPCAALFVHPRQRQVDLIAALGLAFEPEGTVSVDPMTHETSLPGVYAAGDLTTRAQGALLAAAAGLKAAGMLNHELTAELVARGDA